MAVAWVVARLPVAWSNGLGRGIGWLMSRLSRRRRQIALDNLVSALPDHSASEIVGAMFQHFGLMSVEWLRAIGGRPPAVVFEGLEHLERALEPGRGVIVLGSHVGNFELFIHVASRLPAPTHVITKEFSSPVAETVWRRSRRDTTGLLRAGHSGRQAVRVLRRGEILVFVLDQHSVARGTVWVPFFGRPAGTTVDLVDLAHQTGARIVPMFIFRRAVDHLVEIQPAVELGSEDAEGIKSDTARCTALIEAAIRREPAQWTWTHRRWKKPPADLPTQR